MSATGKGKKKYILLVIVAALIIVSVYYQLPYYIIKPGNAQQLDSTVHVKDGYFHEKGDFLFVTVIVGQANIYEYAWASFSKHQKILPIESIRGEDESEKEYSVRQLYYMDRSQVIAPYVAYKEAGKNPQIFRKGVLVVGVIVDMPAAQKLNPGDIIVAAEGQQVKTREELFNVLKGKQKKDSVKLTVLRNGKEKQYTVEFGRFPEQFRSEDHQYGIGITQYSALEIKVEPPVTFETGQIGGPSAGLMFALEIYDQLTKGNLTKGYQIAGTGTINRQGQVGPIGGIQEKIIAADHEGADIFFAPKLSDNYKNAVKASKHINADMKIVPVETFSDAIDFLRTLQPLSTAMSYLKTPLSA